MKTLTLAAAAVLLLGASTASAQDYPSRTIHMVVGFPAGGSIDLPARYFADRLAELASQAVVVENKVGAAGMLAADQVARARPDGHTILLTPNGAIVAAQYLFKKVPFDPVKDFAPVTTVASLPFVLAVTTKINVSSVKEFNNYLRVKNGEANFAATNALSLTAAEVYKVNAKVNATQVPYKEMLTAINDLISGDIAFIFMDATLALEPARAGKLRALAVTTAQRSGAAPELPTMAESGVPNFDMGAWYAIFAPGGTSPAITEKLSGWFNQILKTEQTKKFLAAMGADPLPGSPQSLHKYREEQIVKWGEMIHLAKIEPQ
jgi:tripartite-type tricarboxylate transporter receptor subunit TctC